jgi:hypothetical protein
MTAETHEALFDTPAEARDEAPLAAAPAPAQSKSWREQRWERRRRRRLFEEILGWVLVPAIGFGVYWAATATLAAFGTSPTALIQGIQTVIRNH